MKKVLKRVFKCTPGLKNVIYARQLYKYYVNSYDIGKLKFLYKNFFKIYIQKPCNNKAEQIVKVINKLDIVPSKNKTFFYSIDCFKTIERKYQILDNYSVDYNLIVNHSFKEIKDKLNLCSNNKFIRDETMIINALHSYIDRCKENKEIASQYGAQLNAIASIFERPAKSFFEGLQRILFFNQFLWQTGHKHNGFGRLDHILYDLYINDIKNKKITDNDVENMLCDFFNVLHENCWFKSTMLLGDTGQIIILGGTDEDKKYQCNDLTYKFINVSMKLKLPDPKVLLRCSSNMPDDLLELALNCISTGIGAPFLSNDDAVIPALISFGYKPEDAYNYVTSACWEPLIAGESCDQNNIMSINFAKPFVNMLNDIDLNNITTLEDLTTTYKNYLEKYLDKILLRLSQMIFEEDPLLSLLSNSAIQNGKDIVRGGAEYKNIGVTSIGLASVIDSFMNINKYVFVEKEYTLTQLNNFRKENFYGQQKLLDEMSNISPRYGSDEPIIVKLTNKIVAMTKDIFENYTTNLGGRFKFGLSSPQYINEGKVTEATFDGRHSGDPFTVHISSGKALPITELLSFATQIDYSGAGINGNVVDFFVTPNVIKENIQKFITLFKVAFKNGLYQLQMNVVDSAKLIAAKKDPEKFPDLVVRVWGFSSYFNDLPEEYKDLLIQRAIENEKCA